ncbi:MULTISPECIES: hypothetical protein [unclassified Bradyrhizobium]|uniref:hypothetical protein n=1 Tax=unclassified Bradyrhizobium TaxID=2631580 RepID=UPI0028EA320A|nr:MULTISPECIES: hypothetical protein [unclassified Bradyrhizobium]
MDFSNIKSEFRKEIVRGGEAYLDGQVKIATSADSRASSLAAMYTAATTALMAGGVIAIFNAAGPQLHERVPLILGGACAAVFFLIGAITCVTAIQPVGFYLPGCHPQNWDDDVKAGRELDDCLGERADHIQRHINYNSEIIARNANRFKWGTRAGMSAPIFGLLAWEAAKYFEVAKYLS